MIGIVIIDKIANMLIKDRPVANDKIATLEISNEYLQIFNFLYFLDSSFNCNNISLDSFLNLSYVIKICKVIFVRILS